MLLLKASSRRSVHLDSDLPWLGGGGLPGERGGGKQGYHCYIQLQAPKRLHLHARNTCNIVHAWHGLAKDWRILQALLTLKQPLSVIYSYLRRYEFTHVRQTFAANPIDQCVFVTLES